jgi:hypothetical protein
VRALTAGREEALIVLDLVHDTELHVAEGRGAGSGQDRHRHAARLEPGRRGTRPVDRVDEQDRARPAELDVTAILGIERDVAGFGAALLGHLLRDLVDRHRHVAPGSDTDSHPCALISERGGDRVTDPGREVEREPGDRGIRCCHRAGTSASSYNSR